MLFGKINNVNKLWQGNYKEETNGFINKEAITTKKERVKLILKDFYFQTRWE